MTVNTLIKNSECLFKQTDCASLSYLSSSYTKQHAASNICGFFVHEATCCFDLVSNMLPRIESCSILATCCWLLATSCLVYEGLKGYHTRDNIVACNIVVTLILKQVCCLK